MGSAYSTQHARDYTPEQLNSLEQYNDLVPAYFWTGAGLILLVRVLSSRNRV